MAQTQPVLFIAAALASFYQLWYTYFASVYTF